MSAWREMATDAGLRGEEADQYAAMLEADERCRYEAALRPCQTCDGGDPRCLDCRGSGYIRRAEVADPYEGGHADRDGADDEPLGEPT